MMQQPRQNQQQQQQQQPPTQQRRGALASSSEGGFVPSSSLMTDSAAIAAARPAPGALGNRGFTSQFPAAGTGVAAASAGKPFGQASFPKPGSSGFVPSSFATPAAVASFRPVGGAGTTTGIGSGMRMMPSSQVASATGFLPSKRPPFAATSALDLSRANQQFAPPGGALESKPNKSRRTPPISFGNNNVSMPQAVDPMQRVLQQKAGAEKKRRQIFVKAPEGSTPTEDDFRQHFSQVRLSCVFECVKN